MESNIANEGSGLENKFYVWDVPIKDENVKNIFREANLSQPKIKK